MFIVFGGVEVIKVIKMLQLKVEKVIVVEGLIIDVELCDDVVFGQDDVDDFLFSLGFQGSGYMFFDVDEDILQDFLVEVGEILE